MSWRPLAMLPSVSNERRASVSVETRPRDDFEDFEAEAHEHVIDDILDLRVAGEAGAFAIRQNLVQDIGIGGFGRGLENEAGIGRRILRLEFPHGFEIAGIRDDFREFLKLIELAQFRGGWLGGCGAHNVSWFVSFRFILAAWMEGGKKIFFMGRS
jgi:hypothetical protein